MKIQCIYKRFKMSLLVLALIFCAVSAGLVYASLHPALSTRPAKMLLWSSGKIGAPILADVPWFVWGILAILAFYMTMKHKLSMFIIWGCLLGLVLALVFAGCTPY